MFLGHCGRSDRVIGTRYAGAVSCLKYGRIDSLDRMIGSETSTVLWPGQMRISREGSTTVQGRC